MQNEKHIKGNASHMRRIRPTDCLRHVPTMSVKRNAGRRGSDSQHKVDALVGRYSDRIERKDIRRANRKAGRRVATR